MSGSVDYMQIEDYNNALSIYSQIMDQRGDSVCIAVEALVTQN